MSDTSSATRRGRKPAADKASDNSDNKASEAKETKEKPEAETEKKEAKPKAKAKAKAKAKSGSKKAGSQKAGSKKAGSKKEEKEAKEAKEEKKSKGTKRKASTKKSKEEAAPVRESKRARKAPEILGQEKKEAKKAPAKKASQKAVAKKETVKAKAKAKTSTKPKAKAKAKAKTTTKKRTTKKSKKDEEEEEEDVEMKAAGEEEEGEEEEEAKEEKKEKRGRKRAAPKEEEKKPAVVPRPVADARAGVLLSWGSGDISQLGLGDAPNMRIRKNPTVIKAFEGKTILAFAAGSLHNAVLLDDGVVYTWGCNDDQALGRDDDEWLPAPVKGELEGQFVVQVACGASHTVALTESGDVYSWGTYRDAGGLIGYNDKEEYKKTPSRLTSLSNVVQIAAGENHDLALTKNGTVYQWGDIGIGRRGSDRTKKGRLQPSRVTFKKIGKTAKPRHISKVFAGGHTSFAVSDEGKVWVWGPNNYFQCGVPNKGKDLSVLVPTCIETVPERVIKVASSVHHGVVLCEDGKVYSFGRGDYGRLGHGDDAIKETPTVIAALLPSALPKQNGEEDSVVDVSCGEVHTLVCTKFGKIYSFGSGDLMQLGNGEEEDEKVPFLLQGQQVADRIVTQVGAGSQHSVCLAREKNASAPAAAAAPAADSSAAEAGAAQ